MVRHDMVTRRQLITVLSIDRIHRKRGEQAGSQVRLCTPKPSLSGILPPALPLKDPITSSHSTTSWGPVVQWMNPWGTFLIQATTLKTCSGYLTFVTEKQSC